MEQTITITLKEYEELKRAARELAALEVAGVDNWEWYSEALSNLEEAGSTGWPPLLKEDQTLTPQEIEYGKRLSKQLENGDPDLSTFTDAQIPSKDEIGRRRRSIPVVVVPVGRPKALPQNPNYILED